MRETLAKPFVVVHKAVTLLTTAIVAAAFGAGLVLFTAGVAALFVLVILLCILWLGIFAAAMMVNALFFVLVKMINPDYKKPEVPFTGVEKVNKNFKDFEETLRTMAGEIKKK